LLDPPPLLFVPYAQTFTRLPPMYVAVQSSRPLADLSRTVRQAAGQVDRAEPVGRIESLTAVVGRASDLPRLRSWVMFVVSALGLTLAWFGLYSLIAYTTEERATELSIRMALGAQYGHISRLILGNVARLVAAGIALGIIISIGTAPLARTLLGDDAVPSVFTMILVAIIIAVVSILAAIRPTLRALRIGPARVLAN
jgi:ABC-type antimicrobial peptide transport system permease subunit